MDKPADLRLSSGEDLEPQPKPTRPATVLSTVIPPSGSTSQQATMDSNRTIHEAGGTFYAGPPNDDPRVTSQSSPNIEHKVKNPTLEDTYSTYGAIIGSDGSWIHDTNYSDYTEGASDVTRILVAATKMVAGFPASSALDNPASLVILAFKMQAWYPQLHRWYGSLKGLYDGFPDIASFLDQYDITEGLRQLARLVANEGWGPTIMAALICEHACRKPESSRSRSIAFTLYSLLSADNEDELVQGLRKSASPADQVRYVSILDMSGIRNKHYARILSVDERDGPMWKLCLHTSLASLQAVEYTPLNVEDLRYRWSSISQKKDEYIVDYAARESAKYENYAKALMHLGITAPSPYERLVSFASRLQPNMKTLLGKHMRSKDLTLYAADYDYICRTLIKLEKTYYVAYEFQTHGIKTTHKPNDWIPVIQTTKPLSGASDGPYKGKPKHDCPHCGKKGVRHPPDLCYSNPSRKIMDGHKDKVTDTSRNAASRTISAAQSSAVPQPETAVPQFMVLHSGSNMSVEDKLHVPCASVWLLKAGGCKVVMGIDSFSEVTMVDRNVVSTLSSHGASLETREVRKRTCRAACGSLFTISQEANLPVVFQTNHGPKLAMIWCYVVTNFTYPHILLGASTLSRMKASIDLDDYVMSIKCMGGVKVQLSSSPPTVPPVAAAPSSDLEENLVNLSDEELYQWHVQRCQDLPTAKLSFSIKESAPSVTRKYPIPARLKESVQKELGKLSAQGVIRIVQESEVGPNAIVSPGFAKDKGRTDDDGSPVVRLLCDYTALNAVIGNELTDHWTRSTDVASLTTCGTTSILSRQGLNGSSRLTSAMPGIECLLHGPVG